MKLLGLCRGALTLVGLVIASPVVAQTVPAPPSAVSHRSDGAGLALAGGTLGVSAVTDSILHVRFERAGERGDSASLAVVPDLQRRSIMV